MLGYSHSCCRSCSCQREVRANRFRLGTLRKFLDHVVPGFTQSSRRRCMRRLTIGRDRDAFDGAHCGYALVSLCKNHMRLFEAHAHSIMRVQLKEFRLRLRPGERDLHLTCSLREQGKLTTESEAMPVLQTSGFQIKLHIGCIGHTLLSQLEEKKMNFVALVPISGVPFLRVPRRKTLAFWGPCWGPT